MLNSTNAVEMEIVLMENVNATLVGVLNQIVVVKIQVRLAIFTYLQPKMFTIVIFYIFAELNILFQDEDTGSPLAQKTIKIIFNSEKSLAYITNDEGYITINGCDLKESIENGIAEVGGYCDVNFNHIISYSTAYSTIKSNDLILNLKKSAGK